jgi:hypothetical protein
MNVSTGLLAASAMFLAYGASAATPKLSGTYTIETSTVCQASVPVAPTVVDVPPFKVLPTTDTIFAISKKETIYTGKMNQFFASATFAPGAVNPYAGSITVNGTSWGGDLVFTGAEQTTQRGLKTQTVSGGKGTYSNTATQLSLVLGKPSVYRVIYSGVTNGIAMRADLVSVSSSTGTATLDCIEHGTAVHQ